VNQQINLYQPLFRKQKVVFSAVAMLQVWGIIVVVMAGIAAYGALRLASLETQVTEVTRFRQQAQANLDELRKRQLERTPSRLLEAELLRTRAELAERREIAALMSSGPLSNTRGFSAHLESLARQHVAGTWLTEIAIRDGGDWVNLRGITLAPDVVPVYLRKLLAAAPFSGTRFNVVNLQAGADDPARVWFEVGTDVKETVADGGAPVAGRTPTASRGRDDIAGNIR
jgi:hypothetical protein